MELSIDTSLGTAGIALSREGQVQIALSWLSRQNQTAELLPRLVWLLEAHRVSLKDISCVIAARGPGSFNGIRVGLATAKGLCLGLKLPLVGVSTLEAMAFPWRESRLPICSLLPAGRGEQAAALFRLQRGQWRRLREEHLTTPEALGPQLKGTTLFCGEIEAEVLSRLKQSMGRRALLLSSAFGERIAGVAALGWHQFCQRGEDNLAALQPLYLRPPSITVAKPQEVSNAAQK